MFVRVGPLSINVMSRLNLLRDEHHMLWQQQGRSQGGISVVLRVIVLIAGICEGIVSSVYIGFE